MTASKVSERTVAGYRVSCGHMVPFGASQARTGVNFSVFSANGTGCTLVLFKHDQTKPIAEIPFPKDFRLGHVWAMIVHDLEAGDLEYGFRMEGPWNPAAGHYFDSSKILLDPYARELVGREEWMAPSSSSSKPVYRSRLPVGAGAMEPNQFPHVPDSELIIYEMHVRGFTRHKSSGVKNPGTFAGLVSLE